MSRSFYSYVCPHCDAYDSTRCDMLPPADAEPYSETQLQEAREVGCRVAYYTDHKAPEEITERQVK